MELGYPVAYAAYNSLAFAAAQNGELTKTKELLQEAIDRGPRNQRVISNMKSLETWLEDGGPKSGKTLSLSMHEKMEMTMFPIQPAYPGPLPEVSSQVEHPSGAKLH